MIKNLFLILIGITCLNLYSINTTIFSNGLGTYEDLYNLISSGNPSLQEKEISEIVSAYMDESRAEGINWDIAFVQMCLETGFLKYGGLVTPDQNNFCGLGSFDGASGAKFETIRDGVRAHIQHLKAYGTDKELNNKLIDPRFHFVKRGSATDVKDLTGKWATDPEYGNKLIGLMGRMLNKKPYEKILLADASAETEDIKSEGAGGSEPPIEIEVIENIKEEVKTEEMEVLNPTLKKGWDW